MVPASLWGLSRLPGISFQQGHEIWALQPLRDDDPKYILLNSLGITADTNRSSIIMPCQEKQQILHAFCTAGPSLSLGIEMPIVDVPAVDHGVKSSRDPLDCWAEGSTMTSAALLRQEARDPLVLKSRKIFVQRLAVDLQQQASAGWSGRRCVMQDPAR